MSHLPQQLVKPEGVAAPAPAPGGRDSRLAWIVVGALTVILTNASGARFMVGVVLKTVSEEYGWDRACLSGAVIEGMI
ncbi:MAG: hypothetical protein ACKOCK_09110 [Chloroflexota bacterium]